MAKKIVKTVRIRKINRSDESYVPQPEERYAKHDYGAVIKKYRLQQNISQKQISQDLGYNVNQVHYWESGKSVPQLSIVVPLCNYLHIPLDEFFGKQMFRDGLSKEEEELLTMFRKITNIERNAILLIIKELANLSNKTHNAEEDCLEAK